MTTNLKGIGSVKLHRELDITQKTAWHLLMRIREMLTAAAVERMDGPVEADETVIGGRAKNMYASKRRELTGRGGADKVPVAGVKDRAGGKVQAKVVERTDGATIWTDEATANDTYR